MEGGSGGVTLLHVGEGVLVLKKQQLVTDAQTVCDSQLLCALVFGTCLWHALGDNLRDGPVPPKLVDNVDNLSNA